MQNAFIPRNITLDILYIYITVSSMGNFLEIGDLNFKKYSEKLGEHRLL